MVVNGGLIIVSWRFFRGISWGPPAAQMASKAGYGPKSLITLRAATGEGGSSWAASRGKQPLMMLSH